MADYSGKNIKELRKIEKKLRKRYIEISDECVKEGLSFEDFSNKAYDTKESLYFIDKYIRLKEDAEIEYGKTWKGITMTLEEFIEKCKNKTLNDGDGYGTYATETANSNIPIYPSDINEGIYRKDFTHVIWNEKITKDDIEEIEKI